MFLTPATPVKVDVLPRVALAPATIRITVRVEPKDTNRGLTIVINSENYYRSSFDPDFMGEDGPTIRNYMYELRAPGHYLISAVLKRTLPDHDEIAHVEVCLSGIDVEC
jgi:hypothetical protein